MSVESRLVVAKSFGIEGAVPNFAPLFVVLMVPRRLQRCTLDVLSDAIPRAFSTLGQRSVNEGNGLRVCDAELSWPCANVIGLVFFVKSLDDICEV